MAGTRQLADDSPRYVREADDEVICTGPATKKRVSPSR